MSHQLVIDIPDEVYQPLVQKARASGQSVESLAQTVLARLTRGEQSVLAELILGEATGPRLRDLAGSWASNVPDAGVRHDEHIGQALFDELREPSRD